MRSIKVIVDKEEKMGRKQQQFSELREVEGMEKQHNEAEELGKLWNLSVAVISIRYYRFRKDRRKQINAKRKKTFELLLILNKVQDSDKEWGLK